MARKKVKKCFWEMTTAELREATKQFDEEFVADKGRPLNSEERKTWKKIRNRSPNTGQDEDCLAT
jgi:hypothetical protein